MHSHLKSFDFQNRHNNHFWKWFLIWIIQKHIIMTINHDLKCILYFIETHWRSGFCKSAWKDVSEVPEQARHNLQILFTTAFMPSTTYWLYASHRLMYSSNKTCILYYRRPEQLNRCLLWAWEDISLPLLSPRSRWELKQMSSRGPSNLKNCVILWPSGLDADLPSQAFFSSFIIIPS